MSQTSKPYFSKTVEDKITNVVLAELYAEGMTADETAIRVYIQGAKSPYENSLLEGVAEGIYLATVKEDEFAYKIKEASKEEVDEILESARTKADAVKELVAPKFVPQPRKEKNYFNMQPEHRDHSEKMAAKRHLKFVEKQKTKHLMKLQSFEQSKGVPSVDQVKEAIQRERNSKLSHALLYTRNSPKLGTKATSVNSTEVKHEKDNAVAV